MFRLFKRRQGARSARARTRKSRAGTDPQPLPPLHSAAARPLVIALLGVILWAAGTVSIVYRRPYVVYEYVPGQIVTRNVYSEVDFEYEDPAETRRLRELYARRVPPVYRVDRYAVDSTLENLKEFRERLLESPGKTPESKEAAPARSGAGDAPAPAAEAFAGLAPDQRPRLARMLESKANWKRLKTVLTDALLRGIASPEDIESNFGGLSTEGKVCIVDDRDRKTVRPIRELLTPGTAAQIVVRQFLAGAPGTDKHTAGALRKVLSRLILPNLQFDKAATEEERQRAREAVKPVRKTVRMETLLLRRGARVTEEDLVRLRAHQEALARRRSEADLPLNVAVVSTLVLLVILGAGMALYIVAPEMWRRDSSMVLFTVCTVLQIGATRLTGDVYFHYWSTSVNIPFLLPVTMAAMLLAPLENLRAAFVGGLLCASVAGMQNQMQGQVFFDIPLLASLASLAAGVSIRRARRRKHLFRTGLVVAAVIFAVGGVLAVHRRIPREFFLHFFGLAVSNGMATVAAVFVLLPVLEHIFGRTTDLTLIELSDLNHPLLKRLQLEAPGTYHHSLMVATIAEQAAEAIGANPLLARVCAYFHDIGKLAHPEYFVENVQGQNPHDELRPRMSSRVILNHVKEGIELARKYHLQREIREAISQHHGTSLVYYFYRRALEDDGKQRVGEQDFRYPGPLPERKEITLLSLADACEAAVRSLEKPTPQKIRQQVEDIVNARIRDGQLDNSQLTFRELAIARESIIRTLTSMLHGRVRYPGEETQTGHGFASQEKTAGRQNVPANKTDTHPGPGAVAPGDSPGRGQGRTA